MWVKQSCGITVPRGTSKFAVLRAKRRLSRRYSLGCLGTALAGICLWEACCLPNVEQGSFLAKGSINAEHSPNGAVPLTHLLDSDSVDGASFSTEARPEVPSYSGARRLFMDVSDDAFTMEQRRHGAVILHCIGLLFMFVAIMIVCDEFFVPSLEVIIEVLDLSPDVAGATFMAAGGSAPEFFTSLIGAVVVESDIGTGTIIGSAVFNVLFVIGACALVAPEPLHLTWFPLARDSCFYAFDLFVVTCAFLNEEVTWQEAMILILLYAIYILFMSYSERIEAWAKSNTKGHAPPVEAEEPRWADSRENLEVVQDLALTTTSSDPNIVRANSKLDRASSTIARTNSTLSTPGDEYRKNFRHKSLRTVGHGPHSKGVSEIHESQHPDKIIDEEQGEGSGNSSAPTCVPENSICPVGVISATTPVMLSATELDLTSVVPMQDGASWVETSVSTPDPAKSRDASKKSTKSTAQESNKEEEPPEEDEENGPLDIWPPGDDASIKDWIFYVVTLPIVAALFFTIPDVRRGGCRKYFVITFTVSILWIACFTSFMVWFAQVIATTCGMEDHIMGLTILAAGTSVPDLVTSMIVARQGHGDMAISSSIGSNIFDVTVGLPVPWLLYAAVHNGSPVKIKNEGLEISVMMLMMMLGFTIGTIVMHGWVMTKWMGGSLLFLYLLFEVVSVGLTFAPEGSLKLIQV